MMKRDTSFTVSFNFNVISRNYEFHVRLHFATACNAAKFNDFFNGLQYEITSEAGKSY